MLLGYGKRQRKKKGCVSVSLNIWQPVSIGFRPVTAPIKQVSLLELPMTAVIESIPIFIIFLPIPAILRNG
ncbi:hypothetical protein D3C86_1784800 [compost metagenome]